MDAYEKIAGNEQEIRKLKMIADGLKNADAYERAGAVLPSSVMITGGPGTGKTLLSPLYWPAASQISTAQTMSTSTRWQEYSATAHAGPSTM